MFLLTSNLNIFLKLNFALNVTYDLIAFSRRCVNTTFWHGSRLEWNLYVLWTLLCFNNALVLFEWLLFRLLISFFFHFVLFCFVFYFMLIFQNKYYSACEECDHADNIAIFCQKQRNNFLILNLSFLQSRSQSSKIIVLKYFHNASLGLHLGFVMKKASNYLFAEEVIMTACGRY